MYLTATHIVSQLFDLHVLVKLHCIELFVKILEFQGFQLSTSKLGAPPLHLHRCYARHCLDGEYTWTLRTGRFFTSQISFYYYYMLTFLHIK